MPQYATFGTPCRRVARLRLATVFFALFVSLFLFATPLQAGTITIIDDPDTSPPTGAIYTDAYIETHLALTGSLTISTATVVGGVDDILVEPDVVINWTTGNTLALVADANIAISGTIQHNGPADGSGGVALRAGDDVRIGLGTQPDAIAVGSRHGLTRVEGDNVRLQAGDNSAPFRYVMLGFRAVDQLATYTVTGPISVTARLSVTAQGGAADRNYVQIGHGGASFSTNANPDGTFSGNHTVIAQTGNISFTGGTATNTYVQMGNGGLDSRGNHSGRHTLTAQGNITFRGGSGGGAYAQIGNGGVNAQGSHSGNHTLTAQTGDITFTGGSATSTYAQAGNGGVNAVGSHSGSHSLTAPMGDIIFTGGSSFNAYTQAGNGGNGANGSHIGSHTLTAQGNISFSGGNFISAYAQAGNGGTNADGSHSGEHTLTAQTGDITFTGGGGGAYAQAGNGGNGTSGNHSGDHLLAAPTGNIIFTGGVGNGAYVQAGNGGNSASGTSSGDHTLMAGLIISFTAGSQPLTYAQVGNGGRLANGDHGGNVVISATQAISFGAGSIDAYAQVGNGGHGAAGNHSGDHHLDTGGNITFGGGGNNAYAQVGNGGNVATGNHSGDHSLQASGNITFGAGVGVAAYVQVGNGGIGTSGNHSGNQSLVADGNISFIAASGGGGNFGYAQVGNGDGPLLSSGTRSGDITLVSGENLVVQGARIGHGTGNGSNAISSGNTFIAVGQNNPTPTGSGGIRVGHSLFTANFNSAPAANGGELRFYAPRAQNVFIAANTQMNSELFPGLIPDDRVAGLFLFSESPETHPYIEDYSFYFATSADLAISKQAEPNGVLLPGQPVTYTVAFTNSGTYTATNIVLTDTFPNGSLFNLTIDSDLDPGVTITQTASAPDLAWEVSNLAPGRGGVITVRANATAQIAAPIGFANSAGITGTLDFSPTNNSALVNSSVNVPLVGFAPTSYSSPENAGSAILTVTLSFANPYSDTTVNYASSDGTASASSDYAATNGALTIPAGQSSVTLTVPISDDAVVEADEIFSVTLTSGAGAGAYVDTVAAVTILDDDSATLSIADTSGLEGNSGTTVFTLTVTLSGTVDVPFTVELATVDGSATAGDDYSPAFDTLNFSGNNGETETLLVLGLGDTTLETDETFTGTLSNLQAQGRAVSLADASGVVTIRNDDLAPALTVSKLANVSLARVGETITYTYRITNSGGLTFTALSAVDDALGPITLDKSSLALDEVATGQLTYMVMSDDVPGPLANTVTVTGTPVVGDDVVVTADASVDLVAASFSFTKTVGIEGIVPECTASSTMQVPISTTVIYCFTITNTGSEPLTTHTLEDSQLGTVLDNFAFTLAPGATFSTTVPRTIYASVTNTALWTAGYDGSEAQADSVGIAALPASSMTQATVTISDDDDDQDGDGIPDNIEQAIDTNGDNVPNFLDDDSDGDGRLDRDECPGLPCQDSDGDGTPNFLDPNDATGLDPDEQPKQQQTIFLPAIADE